MLPSLAEVHGGRLPWYNGVMHIEIRIERPLVLLAVIGGGAWLLLHLMQAPVEGGAAVGGNDAQGALLERAQSEEDVRRLREQQSVLDRREEVLRAQLDALEEALLDAGDDDALQHDIRTTTQRIISLRNDQESLERALLGSLRDMWESQRAALAASQSDGGAPAALQWPVQPQLGISATFHDSGYKARFGMEHEAIDIPVEQGSVIYSAADGVVTSVADRGMGFNALVIDHGGGVGTLYGHVSSFLVTEGQEVRAGDPVALSGGRPGTPGAGMFTTGAHLHFEVHRDGAAADPLDYLPTR